MLGALALAALVVWTCASPPEPRLDKSQAPTQGPVLSAEDLADAIRFRTSVGLRADEAWIRHVAADSASAAGRKLYGVPLTPAEVAELDARARNADEIWDVIERYGLSHRREWAGIFLDHKAGGVTALFTGRVAEHQAAIQQRLNPSARFQVRLTRWTLEQLEAFRARVDADQDWLRTIDAWYSYTGVYVIDNVVGLYISSANPAAPALVMEHFNGDGWLIVTSDGIGRWEGPRGTLVIHAVTPSGDPLPDPNLDCVPIPDIPSAFTGGGVAYGTSDEGVCRVEGVGATGYVVQLRRLIGNDWVVVGRGRVTVPPNGEGVVRVVVEGP